LFRTEEFIPYAVLVDAQFLQRRMDAFHERSGAAKINFGIGKGRPVAQQLRVHETFLVSAALFDIAGKRRVVDDLGPDVRPDFGKLTKLIGEGLYLAIAGS